MDHGLLHQKQVMGGDLTLSVPACRKPFKFGVGLLRLYFAKALRDMIYITYRVHDFQWKGTGCDTGSVKIKIP